MIERLASKHPTWNMHSNVIGKAQWRVYLVLLLCGVGWRVRSESWHAEPMFFWIQDTFSSTSTHRTWQSRFWQAGHFTKCLSVHFMDTLNDRIMPAPLAELERPIVFFHVNIPIVFEDIAQLVHIHIVRDCKVQNYQGSFTDVHFKFMDLYWFILSLLFYPWLGV